MEVIECYILNCVSRNRCYNTDAGCFKYCSDLPCFVLNWKSFFHKNIIFLMTVLELFQRYTYSKENNNIFKPPKFIINNCKGIQVSEPKRSIWTNLFSVSSERSHNHQRQCLDSALLLKDGKWWWKYSQSNTKGKGYPL